VALFNEILVGRYNSLLTKLLSIKGPAPSPVVAPEIMPVLTLESDRPEWLFLGGQRLLWGLALQNSAVALRALSALENPAGSGVLVVLERLSFIAVTGAMPFHIRPISGASGLPASGGAVARDTRLNPAGTAVSSAAIMNSGQAGAPPINGSDAYHSVAPVNVVQEIPIQLMLTPGFGVVVYGEAAVGQDYRLTWWWRERALEEAETR
jgi:hypothetical protein